MSALALGNLICLVGSILMILVGFLKKKKQILSVQCVQFGILTIGNLVLGGVTGAISDALSIIRNLICFKWEFTLPFKLTFTGIQAVMTLMMNHEGIIGWLPFAAAVIFTWMLDTKNEIHLKLAIIAGQLLWAIYDLSIHNYTTITFDIFTIISNMIGIWMILHDRKKTVSA